MASQIPNAQLSLYLEGWSAPGDGGEASYRRVAREPSHEGKLRTADGGWWEFSGETANVRQFGAKVDGTTDDSAAFKAALSLGLSVFVPGRMFLNQKITLPDRFSITGSGPRTSLLFLGSEGELRMSGSSWDHRIGYGTFRDLCIASHDLIDTLTFPNFALEKVEQILFDNCTFYHLSILLDNHAGLCFQKCRFLGGISGARIVSQCTFQPAGNQGVSEYPVFSQCFFSGNPIDLIDTVEPVFLGCHVLAGAYGIRSRRYYATGSASNPFYIGPIIQNCTFDSIDGHAVDIEYAGTNCRLIGNFFSSGRVLNVAGVRAADCLGVEIVGNHFEWCGHHALVVQGKEISIVGNTFLNQADGAGVVAARGSRSFKITGNSFANDNSWGGSGSGNTQVAISTPASDLHQSVVAHNTIRGMKDPLALYVEGAGNIVRDNPGAPIASERPRVFGASTGRPSDAVVGQRYFDTSLNLPIWRGVQDGQWVRADGTAA